MLFVYLSRTGCLGWHKAKFNWVWYFGLIWLLRDGFCVIGLDDFDFDF